jgi:alkaline phosphatase D
MKLSGFLVGLLLLVSGVAQAQLYSVIRDANKIDSNLIDPALKPFYHGVASGDPLPTAVIIWTRVTPDDTLSQPVTVTWQMATDLAFDQIVQSDSVVTDASRDYTVKVDVTGLQANTYYYYRFKASGVVSITGRTKTAPVGNVDRIKVVAISCSDYKEGYFQAYRKIADRNDISLVIHLGDYIYEQGGGQPGRVHEPDAEIYRLQDYRQRYSQYHLDPDLRRCHQMHPFATIWDDHDIVVDALTDTCFRHNQAFGPYLDRKFAAVTAAREWLPMRDPDTTLYSFYKNWRTLSFGNLLDVVLIDVRLYDRDRFADNVNDPIYSDTSAHIMGSEQLGWFLNTLSSTSAQWKVVANQLMLAQLRAIDPVPVIFENWDGYPYERNKFFNHLSDNNIDNVVFATGDFHVSLALDVARDPYDTAMYTSANGDGSLLVELVVPSISGGNYDEGSISFGGVPVTLPAETLEGLIPAVNPHIKKAEITSHGYLLLDVNNTRTQGEFWYVGNIDDQNDYTESFGSSWQTLDGGNRLLPGGPAVQPIIGLPNLPGFSPGDTLGIVDTAMVSNIRPVVSSTQPVLMSLYPNPVENYSYLNYVLPATQKVTIAVYNSEGKLMDKLYQGTQPSGNYVLTIDATTWPAGTYYLRLEGSTHQVVRTLLKP